MIGLTTTSSSGSDAERGNYGMNRSRAVRQGNRLPARMHEGELRLKLADRVRCEPVFQHSLAICALDSAGISRGKTDGRGFSESLTATPPSSASRSD